MKQTEERSCFYCGARAYATLKIDEHHPLGRANSKFIVDACHNCHKIQTDAQNKLPPHIRSKNAPPRIKRSYSRYSLGLHLQRLGEEIEKQEKQELEEYHDNSLHKNTHRKDNQRKNNEQVLQN